MKIPQGLTAAKRSDGKLTLQIGDHDLSDLPVSITGPIVECTTPGDPRPVYIVWVPFFVQGEIHNPNGILRMVHEGEATALGLPESDETEPLPDVDQVT